MPLLQQSRDETLYSNHTSFRLGVLMREGFIGEAKLPLFSAYHFKEGGSFSLANHTILRLGELTREGLIGKTKLPLLLCVSLQGKRFFYFSEPYHSRAW